MKEKILSALKTKYANLGLSAETLEGVASQLSIFVKEETGVDAAVIGAEPMLKSFQSFADSRATASKKEAERLAAEIDTLKKGTPPTPPPTDDMPAWAKAVLDKVGTLESSLTNFNAERQSQTLSQKLSGILTEKNVPESFSKVALMGRSFKDETEVQSFVDSVVGQYEAFKQEGANIGFSFTAKPEQGAAPKSDSDEIAKMIETGTKQIVEDSKK